MYTIIKDLQFVNVIGLNLRREIMRNGGDDFGCLCLFTIALEIIVSIHLFVTHFHKHLLGLLVFASTGLRFYHMWRLFVSNDIYTQEIGFMSVLMFIGLGLTALSYIIRLACRYWIYPDIFYEHRRQYSHYFDYWYASVFFPSRLGTDVDSSDWFGGSVLHLLSHIDCLWDYALAGIVNAIVLIGFLLSFISIVLLYVSFNLLYLVGGHVLVALFVAYPGLVTAELLIALVFHHTSASGEFRFFLLRAILFKLDTYLRFVFCVELDIMGWVEVKSQYHSIFQLVYFLVIYVCTGSWAFILLEGELPAVREDLDVKLSPDTLLVMGTEAVFAALSGVFVSLASGATAGSPIAAALLVSSVIGVWAQLLLLWRNYRRKGMLVTVRCNPKNYVVDDNEMEGSSEGGDGSSSEGGDLNDDDDDEKQEEDDS